ncbi:MAG: xanthine dehydrogenase family protein subunit M [Chloroflexi bacterium]|nr:xanthine dehydrogenase family protein subunit M [Chloroflexota bacterium]
MDFLYEKARSLREALELKSKYRENAVFIAGGTALLVDIRNDVLKPEPEAVIDISALDEIDYIRQEGSQISIGAVTKISALQKSPIVQKSAPILSQACKQFANPLIRNRATLGGNLINASPAADMATPLLTLGATILLKSIDGERTIPVEEFFSGVKRTNHRNDELLAGVRFNETQGKRCQFLKMGQRNGTAISLVSLSLMFDVADGVIKDDLKLALGSVAPTPIRAYRTEDALHGVGPSLENIKRAGNILKDEVNPISDVRGSAEYRREMSAALLQIAFQNLGYGES